MMEYVIALIEHLKTTWSIDEDRIYVGGYSLGAFGVWWAILQPWNQDYFAAGFPIGGNTNLSNFEDLVDFPIWLFYGENDGSIISARNSISSIRSYGGIPIFTEHEGLGHNNILQRVRKDLDLIPWMYAQTKNGGNSPPTPINIKVSSTEDIATVSWDMPQLPFVDSIMAYHIYKNGIRLTQGLENLVGSDGSGLSILYRTKTFVDSSYTTGDTYRVTALNYRNQESNASIVSSTNGNPSSFIRIFPNPTTGNFILQLTDNNLQKLTILDTSGRRIFEKITNKQKEPIDLSFLNSGVYIINILTDKGIFTEKIIKQ